MAVICICQNPKCGERFAGSEKAACGYCKNCMKAGGKEAVEESFQEVQALKTNK